MLQQAGSDQFSYFVGVKDENKIIDAGCACAVSFPSEAQKGRVENRRHRLGYKGPCRVLLLCHFRQIIGAISDHQLLLSEATSL
jgi:hypothetical protein